MSTLWGLGIGYRIQTGSNVLDLEPVLPLQTFDLKATGSSGEV